MNIVRFWIKNARFKSLPQSFLPAVLAVCLASKVERFSIWLGLLAIIGVSVGHLGINLFDDYFDYKVKKSDFRDIMVKKGFRARTTKCYYITSKQTTLGQLLIACVVFCAFALLIGLIIWFFRKNFILYLAIITAILGISYSGPPLRLSYHGLGEFVIGIVFGPLLMIGVYYAACGKADPSVFFISIPVGMLVANIVYVHSIMDYEPDKEIGKMTLAVLLKDKRLMLIFVFLLLIISFGCILGGVITGYLSVYYLFVLFTLPMAVSLLYLMVQFIYYPKKKFSPRFWMGPMGDWQQIKTMDIDWFLIRWFLARNMLSFFCFIIIVVCLFV
ncbi:MAG: 1,4-dihydroxy-2-naphthoate octaprenyltransferase [Candidatus Azobacteroides pseudotrichonymphae]|jgi:1,4-dihydroxy-2-naphthoate octaprenyltransferase|nr:prenyltransferase [Bacteroidales bacterium OttesenSCG-928-I14]GMO35416.1 MAG: 1,4-dihydroxy-2-naphthoate octaprenyltransferase [Candidatus Azobacteroides pseudotrichonymphae]